MAELEAEGGNLNASSVPLVASRVDDAGEERPPKADAGEAPPASGIPKDVLGVDLGEGGSMERVMRGVPRWEEGGDDARFSSASRGVDILCEEEGDVVEDRSE